MNRWRADFKWIFGIIFTLVFIFALLMLAMFQATGRESAERTLSAMRKSIVSETGIRDQLSVVAPDILSFLESPDFSSRVYDDPAYLQRKIEAIPSGTQPVSLTPETAGALQEAQSARSFLEIYITPMSFLSAGVHSFFRGAFIILLILSALAAAPFILLSRGLGRAVSAGVSMAVASWGPFLFFSLLEGRRLGWTPEKNGSGDSYEQRRAIEEGANQFAQSLVDASLSVYTLFAMLSLILLLGAAAGLLLLKTRPAP